MKVKSFNSAECCFVSKNKLAILLETKEVEVYNLELE